MQVDYCDNNIDRIVLFCCVWRRKIRRRHGEESWEKEEASLCDARSRRKGIKRARTRERCVWINTDSARSRLKLLGVSRSLISMLLDYPNCSNATGIILLVTTDEITKTNERISSDILCLDIAIGKWNETFLLRVKFFPVLRSASLLGKKRFPKITKEY